MEVAGLIHNLGDAWKHPLNFTLRGWQQHKDAVNRALNSAASGGEKLPAAASSQELSTDTGRAVVNLPIIQGLYALNQAAVGALEQRTLRATGKVSPRDEANFKELQGLAQKYKDILAAILNQRIETMTEGGEDPSGKKRGLKGFATEVFNSLEILGDKKLGQDASQQRVLAALEYSFKNLGILEDPFNPVRIISESFSLYNQILKLTKQAMAVNEATHEKSAKEIISYLKDKKGLNADEIKLLLEDMVKTSMIFTSHPTPGVPVDRRIHLNNISSILRDYFTRTNSNNTDILKVSSEEAGNNIPGLLLALIKSSLFNNTQITPLDETKYLIENLEELKKQLPRFVIALENAYQASFPGEENNVLSLSNILNVRKWTTTDADGNPSNNLSEYLRSFTEKRIALLEDYKGELEQLKKKYTEDFNDGATIQDASFRRLCEEFCQDPISKKYYQLLINNFKLKEQDQPLINILAGQINQLKQIRKQLEKENNDSPESLNQLRERLFALKENFSIKDFLEPLRAIEKNKRQSFGNSYYEGTPDGYDTRLLIKKIKIFGDSFGDADIRQGADYVTVMAKALENQAGLAEHDYSDNKVRERVLQTNDLLDSVKLGEISRLILSMTKSSDDLANALFVSEKKGLFKLATVNNHSVSDDKKWKLPESSLEIVPLTELISDLDKAYSETTIKPLTDPKFRQYLIANNGVLTKMYGPSDSGKWSGPFPSWSGMLKAQYFDSRVIEIFNDFLKEKLEKYHINGATESGSLTTTRAEEKWSQHIKKLEEIIKSRGASPEEGFKEITVVREAVAAFKKTFGEMTTDELEIWKQAREEKPSLEEGIKYKIIDGLGGPVIRGNGADGREGISPTTMPGLLYEQTVQGSEGDKLRQPSKAIDFITKRLKTAIGNAGDKFNSLKNNNASSDAVPVLVDPFFFKFLDETSDTLRRSLREGTIGIDYQDDEKLAQDNPEKLRNYIKMIALTSPALFLGLYNNSSRPITRSGEQIGELLEKHNNDVVKMVEDLKEEDLLKILNDMRAIPIAAFYNLGGSCHISIGGLRDLEEKQKKQFIDYYKNTRNPQSWSEKIIANFMTDMVNAWEKELFKTTPDLMEYAAKTNYQALYGENNSPYNAQEDKILKQTREDYQALKNLIAGAKDYSVSNPQAVRIEELMQDNPLRRSELLAQRQNLDPLKRSMIMAIAAIFRQTQGPGSSEKKNPFDNQNIPVTLRKAFNSLVTAIASNDGSIDH
ncbi:MAG: phosphoenolpyruvate carboxylase [Candidatus Melainabacteria bacterium]|nr:phosphoenolpyruvate carboxylase [Candidatus Melainabacteria bacterium]